MRNPKDTITSYYHFSRACTSMETPQSFEWFLEECLNGSGETSRLLYMISSYDIH